MRRSAVSHLRPDPAEHAASGSAVTGHSLVIGIEDVLYPAEQFEIVADPEGSAQVEQFVTVEPVGVGAIIPAGTDDPQVRAQPEAESAVPVGVDRPEMVGPARKVEPGGAVLGIDIGINPCQPQPAQQVCLLYTSPSPRDRQKSRMPSSA